MASTGQKLNSFATDEHDSVSYRKRVQAWIDGRSVSYEDTSFVTGDSPVVLDVNTDLGRNGHAGYIINDGEGNILVEISDIAAATYGGQHTLKKNEILELTSIVIDKVRLVWVTNSSYRCFFI